MKIENWSRKRSHKLDGIGVGRIKTFQFLQILFSPDSVAYDPMKPRLSESEAAAEELANHKIRSRLLPLLYSSFSACDSTMQSSLDRKRRSHKQNHCSASDFIGLIFTRLYRSTLAIACGSNYDSVASENQPLQTELDSTQSYYHF